MDFVRALLRKLSRFEDLTEEETYALVKVFTEGEATDAQKGAFVMASAMKGTSPQELRGAVKLFREKAVKVSLPEGERFVDTAGTGGDGAGTFNISTVSALVAAGAGAKVVKHGNRSVSSKSGSADLLEALGAEIEIPPEKAERIAREVGFVFLFAPLYHPAMKALAPARREVGVRSLFNMVGPLVNPAGVKRQVVGVFSEKALEVVAEALKELGTEKAFVVHGKDGLDEVSPCAPTSVALVEGGKVSRFTFRPEEVGLEPVPPESLLVNSPEESARKALALLRGEELPERSAVLLNALFALMASGLAESPKEALEMAKDSLLSGKALKVLKAFIEASKS